MTTPQVCLTVLIPSTTEDRLIDWLLAHEAWQIEFSVHPVAARGPLVHLAANEERVQGFGRRTEFKLIVARQRLDTLMQALSHLLRGVDGGFWVLPVEHFTSFRPAAVPASTLS